jgi:hypothetical protein
LESFLVNYLRRKKMSIHGQIAGQHSVFAPKSKLYKGFFGRIFPDLEPWIPPFDPRGGDPEADAFFQDIATTKMIEPEGADASFDSNMPAAYTYFGQFIDHDITFDPSSSLMRQNDPQMLNNFRTPRLDLDNVYGSGPGASPHLYEKDAKGQSIGKFLLGNGVNANEPDLPRNQIGTALIGDPRNDENIIVSQLQLSFLKLHNRIYDHQRNTQDDEKAFGEARRMVTWLYQFIVWNDFVKRIINNDTWNTVLKLESSGSVKRWQLNTEFYNWKNTPFIPIEFSVAAYRFGHSLVRNAYQLNIVKGLEVLTPIFDLTGQPDLRGGRQLPQNHTLQWDWFLKLPSSIKIPDKAFFPQMTRKIDPLLSKALASIPAGPGGSNALAFLNLKRGWRMSLPSGPAVARLMGLKPITTEPQEEALWFYILKEAGSLPGTNGGSMLGRVGSTIVGEVFAGLLYGDPNSYLNLWPTWTPSDESFFADKGPFDPSIDWQLGDLIRLAQMPEDGQQVTNLINNGSFQPTV